MKKKPLTECQEKTLNAIKSYYKKNGYMPTYSELAEMLNVKSSAIVFDSVRRIALKGWIQQDRRPRMMKLL